MKRERWRLGSAARYRVVGGEAVVIQQRSCEFLALNEVCTRILELAAASLSRDEILDRLLAELEVERGRLEGDTDRCLEELADAGVLEAVVEES